MEQISSLDILAIACVFLVLIACAVADDKEEYRPTIFDRYSRPWSEPLDKPVLMNNPKDSRINMKLRSKNRIR